MNANEKIGELKIMLPEAPQPGGLYTPVVEFGGNLAYASGCVPAELPGVRAKGRLGEDMSVEEGQSAARAAALNLLAVLKRDLKDLNRIARIVKLTCFVNCAPDFTMQPQVANGASQLLIDVFGEPGRAARSAVGASGLPGGVAFEIEALVELKD